MMTDEQHHAAAQTVLGWIRVECGEQVAHTWLWSLTPYPCGLPTDEDIEGGLRLACAGRACGPLLAEMHAKVEAEMAAAMEQWEREHGEPAACD